MNIRSLAGLTALVVGVVFVGTGCSQKDDPNTFIAKADRLFEDGNYDQAEIEYLNTLSMIPGDPKILGKLGRLYLNQGRTITAFTFLDEAVKDLPDDPEVQLAFGEICYFVGQVVDARKAAHRTLELEPTDEGALLLLARTCVTTRDNRETQKFIQELRSKGVETAGVHVALAILSMGEGDLESAEHQVNEALKLNPRSSDAYAVRSEVEQKRGHAAESFQALEQATELAPVRSRVQLDLIWRLLEKNDLEAASSRLAILLVKAPDYVPALLLQSEVAFAQRNFRLALVSANKVLDRDRTDYEALMRAAPAQVELNNYAAAFDLLERAEKTYTRVAPIKYELAKLHLHNGEYNVAESKLREALSLAPNYSKAQLLLAEVQLRSGRARVAVDSLTTLLQSEPRMRDAQVLLAEAYAATGDVRNQLLVLQKLVSQEPGNPENAFLLGLALRFRNPDQARLAFQHVVKLSETHWRAQALLADDDLKQGRTEEATSRIEALVAQHPESPYPYLLRAKIRLFIKDYDGGADDLRSALQLNPNLEQAYFYLAKVYYQKGKGQEALDALKLALERSKDAGLFTQLGMLYQSMGDVDSAVGAYHQALDTDDSFVPALNNLAMLEAEVFGRLDDAEQRARKAIGLASDNPNVRDTMGWIMYLQNQYELAVPYLQFAAERLPENANVLYHLAMAHYTLEQTDSARRGFEQVIAGGGETELIEMARTHLRIMAIDPAAASSADWSFLIERVEQERNDLIALLRLGTIESRRGDPAKARSVLESALRLNPESVTAMAELAKLYFGPQPDPILGQRMIQRAIDAAPNDAEMIADFGRIVLAQREFSWAVTLLRSAVKLRPDDMDLKYDLARALYRSGHETDARASLQSILDGSGAEEVRSLARTMARMLDAVLEPDQLRDIVPEARAVLNRVPDDIPALMVLAAQAESQSDFKDAADTYEQILSDTDSFLPAAKRLAVLYSEELADDVRAEKLARQVQEQNPEDPEISFVLGAVNYRKAEYETAIQWLQHSLVRRPEYAQTAFLLGMSYYYTNNRGDCRTYLEQARKAGLNPQESSEAERVLQVINRFQ